MSGIPKCMCVDFGAFVYEYEWAYAWGWNEIFEAEYMKFIVWNFRNSLGEFSWESGIQKGKIWRDIRP